MTHAADHSTNTAHRHDRAESRDTGPPPAVEGLSDRQAVIAVMVASGRSCQEIAFDLLLPVRTVQGHLHQAIRILGLTSVEELTYAVIAARSSASSAPHPRTASRPGPFTAGTGVSALAAFDAAEAAAPSDQEVDEHTALRRELAATRALLDQKLEKVQQLQEAVISRDTIGQAKGILMERHKISAEGAFSMLQQESSRTNRKLVHVAEQLVFSGREDESRARRRA